MTNRKFKYRLKWVGRQGNVNYRYYHSPNVAGSNVGGLLASGTKEILVTNDEESGDNAEEDKDNV